jgi:hypothetical protein
MARCHVRHALDYYLEIPKVRIVIRAFIRYHEHKPVIQVHLFEQVSCHYLSPIAHYIRSVDTKASNKQQAKQSFFPFCCVPWYYAIKGRLSKQIRSFHRDPIQE